MLPIVFSHRWSAARALLWELGRRGGWPLLLGQLGTVGASAIVYFGLMLEGPMDAANGRSLHLILLLIGFTIAVGAALSTSGTARRLYLLPLSNTAITAAVLLPTVITVTAMTSITALCLNGFYDVGWPTIGPAVCLGIAAGAFQTVTLWAGTQSLLAFAGWSIVAVTGADWLRARYGGGWFLAPETMWTTITPGESLTLVSTMAAVFVLFACGVARERRHASWTGIAIPRLWRAEPKRLHWNRYRDATSAQFWYEWRYKGMILPSTCIIVMLFLMTGYFTQRFTNGAYELLHMLIGYGTALGPIALGAGLVMGHVNLPQTNVECGSFLATRPLSNASLAGALLKTQLCSLLLTGGLLIVGLIAFTAQLYFKQGIDPVMDLWSDHGRYTAAIARLGWAFPVLFVAGLLLIGWVFLTVASIVVLSGQRRWILTIVAASVPCGLLLLLVAVLREQGTILMADEVWQLIVGIAAAALTALVLSHAGQRHLIDRTTMFTGYGGWLILGVILGCVSWRLNAWSPAFVVMLLGLLGLAMAPLGAAPLAMSWNRHR